MPNSNDIPTHATPPAEPSRGDGLEQMQCFEFAVPAGNYELSMTLNGPLENCRIEVASRRLLFVADPRRDNAPHVLRKTVHVRDGHLAVTCYGNAEFGSPEVKYADAARTIFLAGDSTVCDQVNPPWTCWGQMLPMFFHSSAAIANYARGGTAARSFVWEKRLDQILAMMRAGDYLLFQFCHNDQKAGFAFVEPYTTYKEALRVFITGVREKAGVPVIVTPVHRAFFDAGGRLENTLGDYPAAARELAAQEGVECLDLSARSEQWLNALGPEKAKLAFVTAPPGRWPKHPDGIMSKSHNTAYGAYELAKCVVREIRSQPSSLARFLDDQDVNMNLEPPVVGPWEALIR